MIKEYLVMLTIPIWFPIKKAARMWFLDYRIYVGLWVWVKSE